MARRAYQLIHRTTGLFALGILVMGSLLLGFSPVARAEEAPAQQAPQPVSVVITSPADTQAVGNGAIVPITATIENAAEYRILIDGVDATGWLPAPFQTYSWNTGDLVTGNYPIVVQARPTADSLDITNQSLTVSVNNTPPLVSSSLIAGSTINGVVAVSGSTNGDSATYQVALFNNKGTLLYTSQRGQLSFTLDTRDYANGAYTAAISAEDSFGNRTIANLTFRIFNAPPPTPVQTTEGTPASPPSTTVIPQQSTPAIISPAETSEATSGPAVSVRPAADQSAPAKTNVLAADSEANQGSWAGQMWYWWLGIIAAGAIIVGFIISMQLRRTPSVSA